MMSLSVKAIVCEARFKMRKGNLFSLRKCWIRLEMNEKDGSPRSTSTTQAQVQSGVVPFIYASAFVAYAGPPYISSRGRQFVKTGLRLKSTKMLCDPLALSTVTASATVTIRPNYIAHISLA